MPVACSGSTSEHNLQEKTYSVSASSCSQQLGISVLISLGEPLKSLVEASYSSSAESSCALQRPCLRVHVWAAWSAPAYRISSAVSRLQPLTSFACAGTNKPSLPAKHLQQAFSRKNCELLRIQGLCSSPTASTAGFKQAKEAAIDSSCVRGSLSVHSLPGRSVCTPKPNE